MRSFAAETDPGGPSRGPRAGLAGLLEAIEAVEGRDGVPGEGGGAVRTGWGSDADGRADTRDAEAPGPAAAVARGAIHEWFGERDEAGAGRRSWRPPLSILVHLARRSLEQSAAPASARIVWIGARCAPYAQALAAGVRAGAGGVGGRLLGRSVFIDPACDGDRLWAIDLALRCPAVAAVIADASRMGMRESRRLQLAAMAGGGLGLLARPWWELAELSAARTRWVVSAAPSPVDEARWTVQLLRCKGVRPANGGARVWTVRRNHETGDVDLVPGAADRPAASERPEGIQRRRTA